MMSVASYFHQIFDGQRNLTLMSDSEIRATKEISNSYILESEEKIWKFGAETLKHCTLYCLGSFFISAILIQDLLVLLSILNAKLKTPLLFLYNSKNALVGNKNATVKAGEQTCISWN